MRGREDRDTLPLALFECVVGRDGDRTTAYSQCTLLSMNRDGHFGG